MSLKIQYFQLKNSIINIIQENNINHIYHKAALSFMYIDSIYITENNIKNIIEYTIGRGKIATLYGTGVNGWLYISSIHKKVSFQYTCHHNNAQIYQTGNINKNDKTSQFIKLSSFSSLILIKIWKTTKNQNNAHINEKL